MSKTNFAVISVALVLHDVCVLTEMPSCSGVIERIAGSRRSPFSRSPACLQLGM